MKKKLLIVLMALGLLALLPVTALAADAVAEVGGGEYEDLQEAINNAQPGDTVTLLADCSASALEIAAADDIILDLNGWTLSWSGDAYGENNRAAVIINNGTLQIVDNSQNAAGKISIVTDRDDIDAIIGVNNRGSLTLSSGAIEVKHTAADNAVVYVYGIYLTADNAEVLVEGGMVDVAKDGTGGSSNGIYLAAAEDGLTTDPDIAEVTNGSIAVTGGEVNVSGQCASVGIVANGRDSSVEISGDGVIAVSSNIGATGIQHASSALAVNIVMDGGEITAASETAAATGINVAGAISTTKISGGSVSASTNADGLFATEAPLASSMSLDKGTIVTGGSFSKDVSNCVPDWYAVTSTADGFDVAKQDTSAIFAGGSGTADEPFVIGTVEQLAAFRDSVNDGKAYAGLYIELQPGREYDLADLGADWTPIGCDEDHPFSGHFDGQGANIVNLTMTKTDSGNADIFYGFFGVVSGTKNENYTAAADIFDAAAGDLDQAAVAEKNYTAVVKDLTLLDVNINTDGAWVGGLAGGSYNAYFANIYVDNGTIVGTNSVGGVLGRGYATVLDNVYAGMGEGGLAVGNAPATVTGSIYNIGGIAGSLRYYEGGLSAVLNSQNYADVASLLSGGGIGGIVGQLGSHSSGSGPIVIAYCNNYGDITIKDSTHSSANAAARVAGGIGGQMLGTTDNVIAYCENHGNITAEVTNPAGALAGIANYYNGLIYQCANFGDISGNAYYSAGLVGHGVTVAVDQSSNSGAVSTSCADGYTSTIIAGVSNSTYQNLSFADVEELQAALPKAAKSANELTDTGANVTMSGVTVADTAGTLVLPEFLNQLISDEPLCDELLITGDRTVLEETPYQNNITIVLEVPGAAVIVPETVSIGADAAGGLTLQGDAMSLVNEGKLYQLTLSGDDIEATNLGTVVTSASITGDNAVFYNGTAEDHDNAQMRSFSTTGKNTVAYNYGSIDNKGQTGHTLRFGLPSIPGTTAEFYNYGEIQGGGTNPETHYIIYAPRFDNVKIVNAEGATMQKNGHWFITYGSDEASDTTGSFAGEKGVFIFQYAENTVLDYDGTPVNITYDTRGSYFVGYMNSDLDLRIIMVPQGGVADPVASVGGTEFADLDTAFAAAGANDEVILLSDDYELTQEIPSGITLVVQQGKSLTVPEAYAPTVLASQGVLKVEQGASLSLAGTQLTGEGGAAVIEAGAVEIQPAARQLTLTSGSKATIPAGQTLNLMFGAGLPLDAVIEDGAILSVMGTLNIPATGDGAALNVNGLMTVEQGGLVRVGSKAELSGSGEISNSGTVTLHRGSTDEADLSIAITLEEGGLVYSQLTDTAVDSLIANSAKNDEGGFTVAGVVDDSGAALIFDNEYSYYVEEPEEEPEEESAPTYRPVIEDTDNGTVSVRPSRPERGDKVTIIAKPDDGYIVDEVSVVDRDGDKVDVTANSNGTYSFIQPRGSVTITVTFRLDSCDGGLDCPSYHYLDVDQSQWYHAAVDYVIENQLMVGSGNTFDPRGTLSRAMLVQILYNIEGQPDLSDENLGYPFADVPGDAWFADAVYWARNNNVVLGRGGDVFGPNDPITRQELMAILYRYEQMNGGGFSGAWAFQLDFTDAYQVSDWAYEAACWCTMNGVVNGYGNDLLLPQGNATRAEAAQMIMTLIELPRE